MNRIEQHPILDIPESEEVIFDYNGHQVKGRKGYTIASALHQAGFTVHSHSLENRERSLECGIGKCGACEMLVDGKIKRICITPVDNVKTVKEIPHDYLPELEDAKPEPQKVYYTQVAIVGAGPAGLACRQYLNELGIDNIVIDNNAMIGGQFNMQTHQFFFFEKEQKYGGKRGFEIAKTLAGDDLSNIFLNSTVWDLLEGKRIAVKNVKEDYIFYVDSEYLVVATGAVPFMPVFENDDLPGVYTAAVVQKMMNVEHTLLGKRILSVGAGNIGYLTSYQAMQAGAKVVAIIEGMDHEGGFPVQANRLRRLGVPIYTSHILLRAIPNDDHTGIKAAVVAECENFKPIPGTEKVIDNIDVINICTGLMPDNQILEKGKQIFGLKVYGAGDTVRVGEGTCAVLRGKQVAMEIAMEMRKPVNYEDYLALSKEYIDSQQKPLRRLEKPNKPSMERMREKNFVIADCVYGFACNPCTFSCPQKAIVKPTTSSVPVIDYNKCIGCMECVSHCPGLAIFGYDLKQKRLFLPFEYEVKDNSEVYLINDKGERVGEGIIEKIMKKSNKTNVARVKAFDVDDAVLTDITGFIVKENYLEPLVMKSLSDYEKGPKFVCHCEDVTIEKILEVVGDRKSISVDELKHTTRLGMGTCRGKRCIPRARQLLRNHGIELRGESTPRGPLSNQVTFNELQPPTTNTNIIIPANKTSKRIDCDVLIAGGGITGSAAFRYFSEAGKKTYLINYEHGSSWRNIGGGRPAFSVPEIAEIANQNQEIFKEIQKVANIRYKPIRYVGLAHDEKEYKALQASLAWSEGYMVDKKDFTKEISPYFNPNLDTYQAALITQNCWQAIPGRVIDYIRKVGAQNSGVFMEDARLLEVQRTDKGFMALVYNHNQEFIEFHCEHFVNALGANAGEFAKQLGVDTGFYPVKHQAFITGRLPLMGKDGDALDMIIDRRNYKGFSAVYGQQFAHTGQIIGCASPAMDASEVVKDLRYNSKSFIEICAEVFRQWIPQLGAVSFQAFWSGYYTEPRYIVDPDNNLIAGMRGHGFMLGQYMAKMYVDKYLGRNVPSYFDRLTLKGDGLKENAFK